MNIIKSSYCIIHASDGKFAISHFNCIAIPIVVFSIEEDLQDIDKGEKIL